MVHFTSFKVPTSLTQGNKGFPSSDVSCRQGTPNGIFPPDRARERLCYGNNNCNLKSFFSFSCPLSGGRTSNANSFPDDLTSIIGSPGLLTAKHHQECNINSLWYNILSQPLFVMQKCRELLAFPAIFSLSSFIRAFADVLLLARNQGNFRTHLFLLY